MKVKLRMVGRKGRSGGAVSSLFSPRPRDVTRRADTHNMDIMAKAKANV